MNLHHLLPESLRNIIDSPESKLQKKCEEIGHKPESTFYYLPTQKLAISLCSECGMHYCRRLTDQQLKDYSNHPA